MPALSIPATALAEACWIVEKGRIPTISSPDVIISVINSDSRFSVAPLDQIVIEKSNSLNAISEMHDRQIAANAKILIEQGEEVALVTCDANITASGMVPIIW